MYAVGLDVDTSRVSFLNVNSVIIIWLFAGNFYNFLGSKTVDEIIQEKEKSAGNCKNEHFSPHQRPKNNEDIGYYLAGLIEGDGYIGSRGFEILFYEKDVANAYFIKNWIGYGKVYKVKDKKAYKLTIFHSKGVEKVWNLVNGKFQGPYKIQQAIFHSYDKKYNTSILPMNTSDKILTTYWLAGFADADGNFSIFITKSNTHKIGYNIIIPFRITQKNPDLLIKIKEVLQGGIIINNKDEFYRYSTVSFYIAKKIVLYFETYHLQNQNQYLRYRYWKKVLTLIIIKKHLEPVGIEKVKFFKSQINNLR